MRRKPFECDCGSVAYRLKHGEPICERCDRMEKEQGKFTSPWHHYQSGLTNHLNHRSKNETEQETIHE
jgi:hypothetical protein